jgi:protein disulfide-isomerase A6
MKKNSKTNEKSNVHDSNHNAGNKKKTSSQEHVNENDVIILTDDNFDNIVFKDEDMWLIAFYAPWCGHCKKLLPEWTSAATQLKGKIKVAKVDATAHQKLAQRYQIKGYPTIKIFGPGIGTKKPVEDYQGPRDASGIVSYALEKLEKSAYVPETKQLINEDILKSECEGKTGICIIVFLPHIADSSVKERNRYLDIIKEVKKNSRGKPIYYLWAQGGDQFDLEDKLHLSFGYPAVIAVHYKKKMFAIYRSSFSKENLINFESKLLNGKEHLNNLPDGIKIKKVPKWDGKEYIPPKEDSDL